MNQLVPAYNTIYLGSLVSKLATPAHIHKRGRGTPDLVHGSFQERSISTSAGEPHRDAVLVSLHSKPCPRLTPRTNSSLPAENLRIRKGVRDRSIARECHLAVVHNSEDTQAEGSV